jgi:hypothetical protein
MPCPHLPSFPGHDSLIPGWVRSAGTGKAGEVRVRRKRLNFPFPREIMVRVGVVDMLGLGAVR